MSAPAPIAPGAARVLAEALSYPLPGLPARLRDGSAALPPEGAERISALAARLEALGPARAEELYTATFDLRPAVSPYAGEHVCGDGARRNALIAWLSGRYAAAGVGTPGEVPDHLAEILRYLASAPEAEETQELAALVLLPAARAAAERLAPDHPYRAALEAVVSALAAAPGLPAPEEAGT